MFYFKDYETSGYCKETEAEEKGLANETVRNHYYLIEMATPIITDTHTLSLSRYVANEDEDEEDKEDNVDIDSLIQWSSQLDYEK